MERFGLALGGGGVVGQAWELGVLEALESELDVDARRARSLVGTSAGAVIGVRLRRGDPVARLIDDLLAPTDDDPLPPEPDIHTLLEVLAVWGTPDVMTPKVVRDIGALARTARTEPAERWVARFGHLGTDWPEGDLRITSVSADTGERQAWTSSSGLALASAVAASCAVPGLFPLVPCGADEHMDGSIWSVANGDVLADADVDVVVTLAPLVGDSGVRRAGGASLQRDEEALAAAGIRSVALTPAPPFNALSGNIMDASRCPAAIELGRDDGRLAAATVAEVLAL